MHDNAEEALQKGWITRGELLRNAANICRVLMNMPCEEFLEGTDDAVIEKNRPADREGTLYEQPVTRELPFDGFPGNRIVKLLFAQDGADVKSIRLCRVK